MTLENIVVNPELSEKLKKVGITKESFFGWRESHRGVEYVNIYSDQVSIAPAYTAGELMPMIRAHMVITTTEDSPLINVYYSPEGGTDNSYTFKGKNLADLLAKVILAQHTEGEFKP